jgi:hypothetical protein
VRKQSRVRIPPGPFPIFSQFSVTRGALAFAVWLWCTKKSLPPFHPAVINNWKKKPANQGVTRGSTKKKIWKRVISLYYSHRGSKLEFFFITRSEKKKFTLPSPPNSQTSYLHLFLKCDVPASMCISLKIQSLKRQSISWYGAFLKIIYHLIKR